MQIPNFVDALEEILKDDQAERKEKYKDSDYRHYPSSASVKKANGKVAGACIRQLYYRAKKEPEQGQANVTGLMTAGFGDAIHYWLLNKYGQSKKFRLMKEAGGRFLYDPLTQEISYRLDGLVTTDDDMGGLEIKTVKDDAITGTKYYDGIKDLGPKEDHLLQVICYMMAQPQLKWFALVYYSRDSAYTAQFNITREGDTFFVDGKEIKDLNFKSVVDRWQELETFISSNTLPPRDFKVWLKADGAIQAVKYVNGDRFKSDFRCMYCPYSQKCWSEADAKQNSYGGC